MIPQEEVEAWGLEEGSWVDITIRPVPPHIDISNRLTYFDPDPDLRTKIDEILYGDN